tara:strand:+ start:145 stop:387 length:243 start_codon:yes stop_codon:yes gene_type:complete
MPKYVYCCEVCDELFEVFHGMKEEHNVCNLCGEENFVYRVPQRTSIAQKTKEGQKTKESIEENRKILKKMKKEARDNFYE